MLFLFIYDDVIKPIVGKDYRKFAPYLLTVFFFIFINNLLGLIPIFPGGANVTGNIAITLVLAVITFLITNIYGTKEYWKEIFWPDVPTWLKIPVPLMPLIEIIGIITKPFALMVRLFANMLAGHMIVLVLISLIFIFTMMMGAIAGGVVALVSVLFSVFMLLIDVLVCFIQAYVFTMLSAIFISMARIEPHHAKH
jgi:F-type H+-transporting ATPase subunit a